MENPIFTYDSYYSALWNVVVTMTTVGYGDLYPRTNPGRIIAFAICISGVILVSMMVVALTNALVMDNSERKSYIVLKRLVKRKTLRKIAAKFISVNL